MRCHTSVRVHEMLRLRWRDFDFEKRLITLPRQVTKTGEQRVIFLPKDFSRKAGKADELAFPLGDYRRQWRKVCVKVGAGRWEKTTTGRKVYVGALLRHCRHTAIRNMIDSGLDRDRAKAISGHKTDSMFTRYNIGKEEDVYAAAKSVEQFHRKR